MVYASIAMDLDSEVNDATCTATCQGGKQNEMLRLPHTAHSEAKFMCTVTEIYGTVIGIVKYL